MHSCTKQHAPVTRRSQLRAMSPAQTHSRPRSLVIQNAFITPLLTTYRSHSIARRVGENSSFSYWSLHTRTVDCRYNGFGLLVWVTASSHSAARRIANKPRLLVSSQDQAAARKDSSAKISSGLLCLRPYVLLKACSSIRVSLRVPYTLRRRGCFPNRALVGRPHGGAVRKSSTASNGSRASLTAALP